MIFLINHIMIDINDMRSYAHMMSPLTPMAYLSGINWVIIRFPTPPYTPIPHTENTTY